MKRKRKKKSTSKKQPTGDRRSFASLLSKRNMGGIIGGGGYDFQTRYIVVNIPRWLKDKEFSFLLHEGTGDVELRCDGTKDHEYEYFQIKNNTVSLSDFRGIIRRFAHLDKEYRRVVLVASETAAEVKSLERSLQRIRGAGAFYGVNFQVTESSTKDLKQLIKKLNLEEYEGFILQKLDFDTNISFLHDDEASENQFIGNLQKYHRDYFGYRTGLLTPAYSNLIRKINAAKGKTLGRDEIEAFIEASVNSNVLAQAAATEQNVPGSQQSVNVTVDTALLSQVEILSNQLNRHANEKLEEMRNTLREGNRPKAEELLQTIKNDSLQWSTLPRSSRAKFLAFEAHVLLNDPVNIKKAETLLDEALDLDPTNTQPRLKAMIAYRKHGPKKALKELGDASDVDSQNLRVAFLLESGKLGQAKEILRRISNDE